MSHQGGYEFIEIEIVGTTNEAPRTPPGQRRGGKKRREFKEKRRTTPHNRNNQMILVSKQVIDHHIRTIFTKLKQLNELTTLTLEVAKSDGLLRYQTSRGHGPSQ
ncbi:uncharacterized protein LOC131212321 isoform X2 [Anopheles bellator]|uniref:uncharacterized protein LOC131212321 isoform X2 n=1 Tax=Anopheles bellator TaxID=139047 RepID=UPI0026484840|nr:uncharacterized protein LOC131212321 isoform X2 [Anopheles bellator]